MELDSCHNWKGHACNKYTYSGSGPENEARLVLGIVRCPEQRGVLISDFGQFETICT